jgi:FG-GAP-like repeat
LQPYSHATGEEQGTGERRKRFGLVVICGTIAATLLVFGCGGVHESSEPGHAVISDAGWSGDATIERVPDGTSPIRNESGVSTAVEPVALSHRIAIRPGGKASASIQTIPDAVCELRRADRSPSASDMQLVSDNDGVVRIEFQHVQSEVKQIDLFMDCSNDTGHKARHAISVVVDESAQEQPPVPIQRGGKKRLPVLDGDPMSYSREEIARRGYPPRPDPHESPGAYATWVRLITSGPTMVEQHPRRMRSASASCNNINAREQYTWSGAVINLDGGQQIIGAASGEFTVPTVAFADAGEDASSGNPEVADIWVGIGNGPLLQDGVWTQIYDQGGMLTGSPFAWTEHFGGIDPQNYTNGNSLPVNSGDVFYAAVWSTPPAFAENWPSGSFSAAQNASSTNFNATLATVGDVNGDGLADAILIDGSTISIMLASETTLGTFGSSCTWPTPGYSSTNVTNWGVGDFNGDGMDDIVAFTGSAYDSAHTFVLLSKGSCTAGFQSAANWQPASTTFTGDQFVVGDINGDGLADVAAVNLEAYTVTAMLTVDGSGGGHEFGSPYVALSTGLDLDGYASFLSDVDGDEKADFIFVLSHNYFPPNDAGSLVSNIQLAISNGSTFGTPGLSNYGPNLNSRAAGADINGDGLGDVMAESVDESYYVSLGVSPNANSNPAFAPASLWSSGSVPSLSEYALGDVNGDGTADIVVSYMSSTYVMLAQPQSSSWTAGDSVSFFEWNESKQVAIFIQEAIEQLGLASTAEWVIERPYPLLANYGTATIFNPLAQDIYGKTYNASAGFAMDMVVDAGVTSNELSCGTLSGAAVNFTWLAVK